MLLFDYFSHLAGKRQLYVEKKTID